MLSRRFIIGLFLFSFAGISPARAEVHLQDTRVWRRAQLLAPGQQVWSFQSSYQNTSDHYSADGRVEPFGNSRARSVTWNQLLKADSVGQADLQKYMNSNNVHANDVAATSAYQIQREEIGLGVNWAYGMTRNWMIGLQIPLTLRTTHVEQDVTMTPTLAQGAGSRGQRSILKMPSPALNQRVKQLAQDQLGASGYDRIPEQKQSWDFGDISLLSQVGLLQGYHWTWALQQMVRLPTAQNPSVSDFVQSSQDEGPVDLGVTSLLDYQMRRWIFGLHAGYVAQLPDKARVRVPDEEVNSGSQVDPTVHRALGDYVWGALDTEYRVTRHLDFDVEYSFLSKAKDHYSAGSLNADYSALEQNTDQQLHQMRGGFFYRIGPETSRSGVMNKWIVSVDYTYAFLGRNSTDASRTALELMSYF